MPRHITRALSVVLAIGGISLFGCAHSGSSSISYERAVEISRDVASQSGYDLDRYALDTFGDAGADSTKWLVVYHCKPVPAPGCSFMVVVDRASGESELFPGE